jgi:hypothetical protein
MQVRSGHDVTGTCAETKRRERGVREEVEGTRNRKRRKEKGNKYIGLQSRTLRRPRKSSKHEKKRDTKTTRVIEGEKKTSVEKKNENKATQKRPPNAVK